MDAAAILAPLTPFPAELPAIIGSVSFGRTVGHQKDHALFNTAHVVSSARDAEQPRTRRRAGLRAWDARHDLTYLPTRSSSKRFPGGSVSNLPR